MMEVRFQPGDEPVPGYILLKFLGAGNFGEVWEARGPGGVLVAMKILSEIDRRSGRKAFRALQLVKNLPHPHLVKINGFWLKDEKGNILDDVVDPNFTEDSTASGKSSPGGGASSSPEGDEEQEDLGKTMEMDDFLPPDTVRETPNTADRPAQLFIAMGLAEETLEQCLKRHQKQRAAGRKSGRDASEFNGIPRDELLQYLTGAAKGLDFLNIRHKIQHGDIKPANVMVIGGEGQLSDFDLARTVVDLKATTTKMGTIAYMPPEVCTDGVPTPTSDQYALAITYYELRTGKLPYSAEKYAVVMQEKVTGNLDVRLLPKAERAVIRRATSVHPTARYPSCEEMVAALRGRDKPLRRFLMSTAALLLLLVIGLGVWESVAPPGYSAIAWLRKDSVRQTIYETLAKQMEEVAKGSRRLTGSTLSDAFRDFYVVLTDTPESEKLTLKSWNSILMKETQFNLHESLINCNNKQDAEKQLLPDELLDRSQKHLSQLPAWLKVDDSERVAWAWKCALAEARLRAVAMEPAVNFDVVLQQLSATKRPSSIDEADSVALSALTALAMAKKSKTDLLTADIVKPLAVLCRAESNFKWLTQTERTRVAQLQKDVSVQTDDRIRKESADLTSTDSTFDAQMARDLVVVTGIPVPVLEKINAVRKSLETTVTRDSLTNMQRLLQEAYEVSKEYESGSRPPGDGNTLTDNQKALERIEELELLLFLKDPDSQALFLNDNREGDSKPAPIAQAKKLLTNTTPYYGAEVFCNALLTRAELAVLGRLNGVPLELDDVAAILSENAVQETLGVAGAGYKHWLNWIRGVANITPQTAEYADYGRWEELLQPFPAESSSVRNLVSSDLAALVGICQTECLVVSKLGESNWQLSDEERTSLAANLHGLPSDMIPLLTSYRLLVQTIYQFALLTEEQNAGQKTADGGPSLLLEAIEELISTLQSHDSLRMLITARSARRQLLTKIVFRATLLDEEARSETGHESGFVKNPFREGGAAAAFAFLDFLSGQGTGTDDAEHARTSLADPPDGVPAIGDAHPLSVAASAAFFKDPRELASACEFADSLIARYTNDMSDVGDQLPSTDLTHFANGLLISAHAHAELAADATLQSPERAAHTELAIRAISFLASRFQDKTVREKAGLSHGAYFQKLVDGMRLAENSPIGAIIKQTLSEPDIASQLGAPAPPDGSGPVTTPSPEADGAELRANAAAIFSAAATFLPSPLANDSQTMAEQERVRPAYYLVSSRLESGNPEHLLDYAIASLALLSQSGDTDAEITFLNAITKKISLVDPGHTGRTLLEGRKNILEARRLASRAEKEGKYREVLLSVKDVKDADVHPQHQLLLRLIRANSNLELANVMLRTEGNLAEIRLKLAESIEHANFLINLPDEQQNLVYMPFVHMVLGNATEDLEYLLKDPGKYEEAIKIFETGRTGAIQKGDEGLRARFDFSIARCHCRICFRLTGKHSDHDIQTARKLLLEILGIDDLADLDSIRNSKNRDRPFFAECCVYLGRIHERLAFVSSDSHQRLAELVNAVNCMSSATALADDDKLPERFIWRLEYAEFARDACAVSNTKEEFESWKRRCRKIVDELLSGEMSLTAVAKPSREQAEVALSAIVKVLMELDYDLQGVAPYVDAAEAWMVDSELRCHLLLRQAQYACDSLDKNTNTQSVTAAVEKSLGRAQTLVESITAPSSGESADIWSARIEGQRAILADMVFWVIFSDPSVSPEKKAAAGVAALDALSHAARVFENLGLETAESDAVWLRFAQGRTTQKILRDRKYELSTHLDQTTMSRLHKQTIADLRKILQPTWEKRAILLSTRSVLLKDWTWGFTESDQLTLGRGKPIEYTRVLNLLRDLGG